jgi:hypothetical protein
MSKSCLLGGSAAAILLVVGTLAVLVGIQAVKTAPPVPTTPSPPVPTTPSPVFITREEAIRIAADAAGAVGWENTATAELSDHLAAYEGRWVWHVNFDYHAGPTSGRNVDVYVDAMTGAVLNVKLKWISRGP